MGAGRCKGKKNEKKKGQAVARRNAQTVVLHLGGGNPGSVRQNPGAGGNGARATGKGGMGKGKGSSTSRAPASRPAAKAKAKAKASPPARSSPPTPPHPVVSDSAARIARLVKQVSAV